MQLAHEPDVPVSSDYGGAIQATTIHREPPAYGHRKGWVPRSLEDYGDGGAFPEIHVAQYPLNMGKKKSGGVSCMYSN